jgi:streptomycin 6-kinase
LARNAVRVWGDTGRRWLAELPRLIDEILGRWSLRLEGPLPMSFHFVAAVTQDDGTPAVLKLAVPGSDHQPVEAAALRAYAGGGAVRLLSYDPDRGALLLRRAVPGRMLRHLVPDMDEGATAAVVSLVRELHAAPAPDAGVPPLARARSSFVRYLTEHVDDASLPRRLVSSALSLFDDLVASAAEPVLLHGDLHHDNILSDVTSSSGWVAIDPHGWVGDAGYDVGAMLYNPAPENRSDALLRLVPARIEQLADGLGLPPDRVVAWGFVKAVLSEVWTVQDGGQAGGRSLDVAQLLAAQL